MTQQIKSLYSVLLWSLLLASGCKTMGLDSTKILKSEEEQELGEPVKMVVTWKDTVRYSPTDKPTRGFGARIHFYDIMNRTVKTKGTLTIYGFNDSKQKVVGDEKPDLKFVFDQSTFEKHYSKSKLGHSYSFWIPWDEAGGPQTEVALAPFFTSYTGQVIISEQSRQILPGKKMEELPPAKQGVPVSEYYPEIMQTAYNNSQPSLNTSLSHNPSPNNRPRLRTTTIHVPSSMEQRMLNQPETSVDPQVDRLRKELAAAKEKLYQQQSMQEAKTNLPALTHQGLQGPFGVSTGVNLQKYTPGHLYNRNLNQGNLRMPRQQQLPPDFMTNQNTPMQTTTRAPSGQLSTRSLPPRPQAPSIQSVQQDPAYPQSAPYPQLQQPGPQFQR